MLERLRRKRRHVSRREWQRGPLVVQMQDEGRQNLTAEPRRSHPVTGVSEPVVDTLAADRPEERKVVGRDVDRPTPRALDTRVGKTGQQAAKALLRSRGGRCVSREAVIDATP